MRKLFLKISMLLLVLGMSTNAAWAINISGMTDEEAEANAFWARLTAKPASTTNGSGKVFVVSTENYEGDPTDEQYAVQMYDEGWSDIFLASSLINANAQFRTFAKADNGSYFTGWSFTDGYTDLGTESSNFWVEVTPSATKGHTNYRNYNLYAAFKAVQLVSYEMVDGSQEVADDGDGNWTCTQTIKFRAETPGFWALSSTGDERHFKRPVIAKKTGTTGSWAIDDAAWITSGVGQNVTFYGEYAELTVPVTFTAPNSDVADYAATLTLETEAGVKMTAYLYARRTVAGAQAIRYNKSKVPQETGNLTDLLGHAATDDIIKLNGNYSNAVSINKSITFDLNGYTLSNTLTVSGGNVTLAYSPYGGTISGTVSVTGGKLALNGGEISGEVTVNAGATLEQNGAIISGNVNNNGTLTTTDGKCLGYVYSKGTLNINGGYFKNEMDFDQPAITVTGGTASINRGDIGGTDDDQCYYGVKATGGAVTIGKLASVRGETYALWNAGGSITVNGGKFFKPEVLASGEITFLSGYFKNKDNDDQTSVRGKQIWRNTAGPEAREGYAFFAGSQDAAQAANVSVCRIGKTSYNSLEEALAYANNSGEDVIIIMENDYTLKAGYYTLPSNATLIVPMSNDQETANQVVPRDGGIETPVCFRKLIFENGVNMEVAGTIEVTCTQYGSGETMGIPGGNYGHLIMKPGSHMTINNGGYLRAWGFVTGDGTKDGAGNYLSGEIDVRRGGTVHEMFQMGDWKGGDISFTIAMEVPGMTNWRDMAHLFPIYTYFIQNVESPVKYHPGASLICATSVNVSGSINAYANDIKVVGKEGEAAMFLMDEKADAENTWVRKYYDAKKDQQVYEVNSGAKLGSMVINLGEVPGSFFGATGTLNLVLDSRKFVLPLTNNFKIHLLSGYMQFTQSTSCLPGMEVEIDKESEVSIIKNDDETIVSGGLYFYDADQWSFRSPVNSKIGGYVGNSGKFGAIVRYSPTWDLDPSKPSKPNVRDISSPAAIGDAILNVHGTFRMGAGCAVYTTWSKNMETFQINEEGTGGASVISSNEDAGTFIFDADAPEFDGLHFDGGNIVGFGPNVIVNYDHNDYGLGSQYPVQIPTVLNQSTPTRVFGFELCTPVKLQNGDGTFVETSTTTAGTSYCYRDGRWTTMQVAEDECFMKEIVGGQTTYYAKPSEYVAVAATWDGEKMVGNADHTFSDKDGAGRLFILMDDCQWWEVENVDNLYHCIHPNNDTYYYWDDTAKKWVEQRFTITWLNWDGTEIKSYVTDGDEQVEVEYSVTYGTQATFLGSNPTRDADIDYTYDFAGWNPELGPVKSNVTYTATYVQKPRKYTIIFTEEGGAEIERHFLLHNDMPECENVPTRTGFTLQWEPALAAVTGDATYRATWLEEPPTEYEITFIDYDGTELKKGNVEVGTMPMPPVSPSGKPATSIYTYVFDHWSPTVEKVSQAVTYTAVYREENRKYSVTFKNEDNSLIEINEYSYGETPVCSTTPTKDPTAQYTYAFAWTPQIQTVMGDAVYTATFTPTTNKYSVSVKCSPSGAATVTGSGLYDYNESATAATVGVTNVADGYKFDGWADLANDHADKKATSRQMAVTGDINLVAEFTCSKCDNVDIVWNNWDGSHLKTVSQAKGTATTYTGATPQKTADAHYTYKFDGWTLAMNTKRDYKNGLTPVAAEGGATYYAHFDSIVNTYKVTLASNPAGVATLAGAGTYNYNDADEAVTIAVTNYNHDNFTFTGWTGDIENASESFTTAITGNINLTANFASIGYTINWYSEDGEDLLATNADLAYGTKTVFGGATPTKEGSGAESYTFDGWTTIANGEGAWYAKGNTPSVTGDANYYAHFRVSANNIEITNGKTETLVTYVERKDLVLTSNGYSNSGELIGSNYLTLQGDAHFDMTINAKNHQWYAVAVPWQVDATNGISVNGRTLTLGTDFDLVYYDGARRAAEGKVKAWRYVEDDANKIMYPGKLYMIGLMADANTIRFTKRAEAGLLTTTANVTTYPSGESTDANWNGVANPALFKAYVNPGVDEGQTYDPDNKTWGVFDFSEGRLVVGQGAFVQAPNPKSIVVSTGGSYAAPRRAEVQNSNVKFDVRFAAEDANYTDRLFVKTTDEKAEEGYVIGQDLVKFSTNAKLPQMWINRYDQKLCVNTAELINETAVYPLGIYAPAAGNYSIRIQSPVEGMDLYLTYNGEAIWNLSDNGYTLNLNKGTTNAYGLRISVKKTPAIVTGIDEAVVDAQGDIRKVLINDKVFIIRGDKVYTVEGQLVK